MGFTAFALPLILLTALVEQVAADEPIALSSVLKKYASKQHRTSAADARASPNARTFVAELTPVDFGRFGWETWQMNIGLGTPGRLIVCVPVLRVVCQFVQRRYSQEFPVFTKNRRCVARVLLQHMSTLPLFSAVHRSREFQIVRVLLSVRESISEFSLIEHQLIS